MKAIVYKAEDLGAESETIDIPADLSRPAKAEREKMVEVVAEMDDELTHKYLEGHTLSNEDIKRGLRSALSSTASSRPGRLRAQEQGRPAGARRGRGLPAVAAGRAAGHRREPGHAQGSPAHRRRQRAVQRPGLQDRRGPVRGQAGLLPGLLGHAQGRLVRLNATKGKKERIGRILQMHANHREEIDIVYAGDIAAAVGLKESFTGDTLSDPDHPIILESIVFPEPVIEVAIEPKTKADQDKLALALQRLAEEDPTFRVHTDEESGQTRIAGMGELHLDVLVDRMVREFKVAANVGGRASPTGRRSAAPPRATAATSSRPAARASTAMSSSRIEPNEPGKGYEFVDKIVGGTIPREYIKPIDMGIREALETGPYAGYPMVDVKVTLFDGSFHEVDSSEMAFKIAGSMAIKDAVAKAHPVILEPLMRVEVTMPGAVPGRRHRRSQRPAGPHRGDGARGSTQVVRARVPLADDVRLRHRPAVDDPGSRQLLDGVVPLRRGPRQPWRPSSWPSQESDQNPPSPQ
jgi:elongation factor G